MSSSKAFQALNELDGLLAVKSELRKILDSAIENTIREENEDPPQTMNLNRVFLGNPGTGAR